MTGIRPVLKAFDLLTDFIYSKALILRDTDMRNNRIERRLFLVPVVKIYTNSVGYMGQNYLVFMCPLYLCFTYQNF